MALERAFTRESHSHVILLEDDLLVAPDFLSLFASTAWLLEEDPTLWCVSAWNDNGHKRFVKDEERLFRTDYFPGEVKTTMLSCAVCITVNRLPSLPKK